MYVPIKVFKIDKYFKVILYDYLGSVNDDGLHH